MFELGTHHVAPLPIDRDTKSLVLMSQLATSSLECCHAVDVLPWAGAFRLRLWDH